MKLDPALDKRLQAYLDAVDRHLAAKPAAARREILDALREQALESLERHDGTPTPEALEQIIAAMDAPECFAEVAAPGESPFVALPPSRTSNRWFLLTLAFFMLNAYGVWRYTRLPEASVLPPGADEIELVDDDLLAEPTLEEVEPAPSLGLTSLEQIDLSASREVTLRLVFTAKPDPLLVPRFLVLNDSDGVEIPYELQPWSGSNSVILRTGSVLSEQVTLVMRTGLPSADTGILPSQSDYRATVPMKMNMTFRRLEAASPSFERPEIRAVFSSFPAPGLDRHIAIEPPVAFTAEPESTWYGGELVIRGEFKPGGVYAVTFKEGLPAANGSSLSSTITRSVQFPPRSAALDFPRPGRYLSPQGLIIVPVAAVNVPTWAVSLYPVFANNLVYLASRENQWFYHGDNFSENLVGEPLTHTNHVAAPMNDVTETRVPLRDLSDQPLRGAYWMEATAPNAGGASRLIVITDLGLAVRSAADSLLVWVNSLSGAEPVSGASVTIYARNNQPIARGETDTNGLLRLNLPDGAVPFLVTAEEGSDLTFISLDQPPVVQGDEVEGPAFLDEGGVEASVFTDRGVYRPGETVFMQAIARDRDLQAPTPFPAQFRVVRPDGRIFKTLSAMLNESGTATATAELPAFLPTGRYAVQLVMPGTGKELGSAEVALEDFVPPQIRVAVEAPALREAAGTTSTFFVRSEHLFGGAAAGLKVKGYASIKAAPFASTNWPGWSFGDDEKTFTTVFRPLGSYNLDDEGRTSFAVETAEAWRPPAALEIVQQAVVMETGGRSVTAYGRSRLDPYPFYIGVRADWEGTLRTGETQLVQVVEVAPDGSPAPGKALIIYLYRVTWNSALRQNGSGRYEWTSSRQLTLVREDTLAATGAPRSWAFSLVDAGDYQLLVRDPASGASTRLHLSAASPDHAWVAWSREKPGRVLLQPDRERYRPGEVARLLVKAPFSGPALLTIESGRVREERLVRLEKNTAELEIPIRAEFFPNVYATLTLIRPAVAEPVWQAHRAIGAVALPVVPANRQLHVKLDAPERLRPRSELTTRVTVTDETGAPVNGEVTLMAVDEGICLLTAHTTPDPNATFLVRRGLPVTAYDLYSELMPLTADLLSPVPSAGGDMESGLRGRLNPVKANRFKPVALWQVPVRLGPDGTTDITLNVPEFTGELRLMAVAVNATQAGSTQRAVKVSRDLISLTSLPRFLAPGDAALASVYLVNQGEGPVTVRMVVTCGGPLHADNADRDVALPSGATTNLFFSLTAGPAPGKANCRIAVTTETESYDETIELAVRPASGSRSAVTFAALQPGESITLAPPTNWLDGTARQAGTISTLRLDEFAGALDYLLDYPYGCLEQTASMALPLIHAPHWLDALPPSAVAYGDSRERIAAAITRLLAMQQGDGGFALWPFERRTDTDASMYAVQVLLEAAAAGHTVPEERLAAALRWVRAQLDRATVTDVASAAWRADMSRRAYACHLLALAGKPEAGWTARLREVADRLDHRARVYVASALLLAGEPRHAVNLLKTLGLPEHRERLPGDWSSGTIGDAALLMAVWLEIDPDEPVIRQLAQTLMAQQSDGHWGTTQDNALALHALGKYAARNGIAPEVFRGTLTGPGGDARSIDSAKPFTWHYAAGEGGTVVVSNQGPGVMMVWVREEGIGLEPEEPLDQGVRIRRDYFNLNQQPVDPALVTRGDLIIVRLTIDAIDRTLDQLVVEDLLPAGWEIENPNLAASQQFSLVTEVADSSRHREARDDRMLVFPGPFSGTRQFYYAARAVTPGDFIQPPAMVSGMYNPQIRSVHGGGKVRVDL